MGRLATVVVTLVVALLVVSAIAVAMAMAGVVPVAAGQHHFAPIEWYLETASDAAVERGGKSVHAPPDATSPEMLRVGLIHYQQMCVNCHGAPGIDPSDVGKGLYPDPPRLARHKDARIEPTYWIVKNGVRDTGMPAFGPTHSEKELWAMAALAVTMPHWTPQEYAARAAAAGVPKPLMEMDEDEAHEGMEHGAATAPPSPPHGPH